MAIFFLSKIIVNNSKYWYEIWYQILFRKNKNKIIFNSKIIMLILIFFFHIIEIIFLF